MGESKFSPLNYACKVDGTKKVTVREGRATACFSEKVKTISGSLLGLQKLRRVHNEHSAQIRETAREDFVETP